MTSRSPSPKPPLRSRVALPQRSSGGERFDLRAAIWAVLFASMAWSAVSEGAIWTTFTSANGLPESRTTAVAVTDSQTVLVTTPASVVEYDGIRFHRILARYATPPVFTSSTSSISPAPNGDIWVGTFGNGVFQLRATDWVHHTRDNGLGDRRDNRVTSLWIDDDGTVWAGTANGGLSKYDGTAWFTYTKSAHGLHSDNVWDVERAPGGALWVVHNAPGGGLSRFDGFAFTNTQRPGGLERSQLKALLMARDGRIWTCSQVQGVGVFDAAGNWLEDFDTTDGLVTQEFNGLAEGVHGDMWLATVTQGLLRWVGQKWEHYPASAGLADNVAQAVAVTKAGVLWAATQAGLSRFEGAQWLTLDDTNVLPNDQVTAAAVDLTQAPGPSVPGYRMGSAYVGTRGAVLGNLVRLSGFAADTVRVAGGVTPLQSALFSAATAIPGGAWVAGTVQVPSLPPPNNTVPVLSQIAGPSEVRRDTLVVAAAQINGISVESDNSAWLAMRLVPGVESPLYHFQDGQWLPIFLPSFTGSEAFAIARDGQGRVYLGSYNAPQLTRYDPSTSQIDLLEAADGLPGFQISALFVDSRGDVWAGTDAGLALIQGFAVTRVFGLNDGLPSTAISQISEDEQGRIWAGTNVGFAMFDGATWTGYSTSDGLPGSEVVFLHADGDQALVGTKFNGMSLFHIDPTPPRGQVTAGPPPALGSRLTQMAFGGGDLDSPSDFLRFSWSLDGDAPRAFSDQRSANLTGLADGPHAFEVWVRDRALNVTPVPARYEFEVDATPPQPIISTPSFGSVVAGVLPVEGTVADTRFLDYKVDVREVGDEGPWTVVASDVSPPAAGAPLATWDTGTVPDGRWEIRVTVRDTLDLAGFVYVETIVDNLEPKNDVTSPARVVNQTGGRIFSLNGELEVYFPPQSLDQDRVVVIDPTSGPANPPPGASRLLGSWRIEPDGFEAKKPVTITFAMDALDSLSKAAGGEGFGTDIAQQAPTLPFPGVFEMRPDSTLHYLGGSVNAANGTLTTTSTRLGALAVYEGLFATSATNGRNVDIQPRAFSPTGSTFDDRAAISFDLSGSENVRVYVYDRLGRIVRRVYEGSLGPGRNVVYWDGRDGNGDVAPSGIYLVAIDAEGQVETKSVAVVNR